MLQVTIAPPAYVAVAPFFVSVTYLFDPTFIPSPFENIWHYPAGSTTGTLHRFHLCHLPDDQTMALVSYPVLFMSIIAHLLITNKLACVVTLSVNDKGFMP